MVPMCDSRQPQNMLPVMKELRSSEGSRLPPPNSLHGHLTAIRIDTNLVCFCTPILQVCE